MEILDRLSSVENDISRLPEILYKLVILGEIFRVYPGDPAHNAAKLGKNAGEMFPEEIRERLGKIRDNLVHPEIVITEVENDILSAFLVDREVFKNLGKIIYNRAIEYISSVINEFANQVSEKLDKKESLKTPCKRISDVLTHSNRIFKEQESSLLLEILSLSNEIFQSKDKTKDAENVAKLREKTQSWLPQINLKKCNPEPVLDHQKLLQGIDILLNPETKKRSRCEISQAHISELDELHKFLTKENITEQERISYRDSYRWAVLLIRNICTKDYDDILAKNITIINRYSNDMVHGFPDKHESDEMHKLFCEALQNEITRHSSQSSSFASKTKKQETEVGKTL